MLTISDEYQNVSFEQLARKSKDMRVNSILESHVYRAYNNVEHAEAWRNMPEIPTQNEIMPCTKETRPTAWDEYQHDPPFDPSLPRNIVDGPWESKDAYLEAQYKILRKDATFSLQTSVEAFKRNQVTVDDRESYVYTDLTIKGILASTQGLAFRVEFLVDKSSKRVNWSQSKRLTPGTIVALSPEKDGFKTVCKVAVVAARPLENLLQNPPSIELFFAENDDIEIDPMQKLIMIEARSGFFEAKRYMLLAIQKLMTERWVLLTSKVYLANEIGFISQIILWL
jgi:helicase required for RNAi-mediated heterochromatin assembly 1